MNQFKGEFYLSIASILFIFLVVLGFAYMEARSYNKYCPTKVTVVDAMFLDLRIDECNKK